MLTITSKATADAPSLTPITKARIVRAKNYQACARKALIAIRNARADGLRNAREFAAYMNAAGLPAPNGGTWNESSVLRTLKCLRKLGIDNGSLPHGKARKIWYVGAHSKGVAVTY